jgi:hypothetical protein
MSKYAVPNGSDFMDDFAGTVSSKRVTGRRISKTGSHSDVLASKGRGGTGGTGELVMGSACAAVDASLERCAGWAFAEAARLRTKDGDNGHRVRCDVRPQGRRGQVVSAAYKIPGGKLLTRTVLPPPPAT